MAVSVFEIPAYVTEEAPNHRVYIKGRWSDEWGLAEGLYLEQLSFVSAPDISTARLRYQYGFGMDAGKLEPTMEWVGRMSGMQRAYVKVEVDGKQLREEDPLKFEWYGVCEELAEFLGGTEREYSDEDTYVEHQTGVQMFTALGLESLLANHTILTSFWRDPEEDEPIDADSAFPFNNTDSAGKIIGNRAADRFEETGVFHPYLFTDNMWKEASFWSSSDIVGYLLKLQTPRRDDPLAADVPFELQDAGEYLPTWDKPVVQTEGKTTWQVICELLHRGKMLSAVVVVVPGETEIVQLRPFTLVDEELVVEGTHVIKANPLQVRLALNTETSSNLSYGSNSYLMYDQVITRGALRTSTGSFAYTDYGISEMPPFAGWETEQEDVYKNAAKDRFGYASLSKAEKQQANTLARSQLAVDAVYSRFILSDEWDCNTGSGMEITGDEQSHDDFFIDDMELIPGFPVGYEPKGLVSHILPSTRLRDGYDWSVLASEGGPSLPPLAKGPHNLLPPQAFFVFPGEDADPDADPPKKAKFIEGRMINKLAKIEADKTDKKNFQWSAEIRVPKQDRSFWIRVQGAPQHVLVGKRFDPPTETLDKPAGAWDWQKAIFTLAIQDDRITESRWPDDNDLPSDKDSWRRLVIDCGEKYRCDYLVPNTAVAVDPVTGELKRCTAGGFIVDDRPKLLELAKRAHAYYSKPRRSMSWQSRYLATQLNVGDYLTEYGDTNRLQLGAVITEITISIPVNGTAVTIAYKSDFMQLDKLREVIL